MAVGNNFKLKETIIKISLLAACLLNQKCSHPFPAFSFTMQANTRTGITFSSISEISSCKRNPENPGLVSKKEKFIWDPQSVIYKGRTGCSFVCHTTEESILFSVASIRLFPYNQSTVDEVTSRSEAPPGAGGSGMPDTLRPTLKATEEEALFSL